MIRVIGKLTELFVITVLVLLILAAINPLLVAALAVTLLSYLPL